MTTDRPSWTISEAAERCGVSKSTIRRYRDDERFPHAYKDTGGAWKIPLEDLLAAGLKPVDPNPPEAPFERPVSGPSERERELEMLLEVERAKRESAERVAAIAIRAADDLSTAMKMIEARTVRHPEPAPEQPATQPTEQPSSKPQRRRWWHL